MTFTGFDPGTFRFQEQNTTSEPRRLITTYALKKITDSYSYDTVLAIFSQFPPLCATQDLYSTNLDLMPQLFCVYDLGGVGWGLFQNKPFGLYLGDP